MSHPLSRLLAGLLVSLAVLSAAEGGLRLLLGPPPAPIRVFGALGEHDACFQERDGALVTTYQDDPLLLPVPPPPDIAKAAFIGGSSLHGGSGLSFREEAPYLAGWQAAVMSWNLAAPGLDSYDLLHIVDDLSARLPPEVWVVYAGHNDIGNAVFQRRYGTLGAGLAAHLQATLERSRLYVTLSLALAPVRGTARMRQRPPTVQPTVDTAERAAALRHFQANMDHIAWRASQTGALVLWVSPTCDLTFPYPEQPCDQAPCAAELHAQGMALRGVDPAGGAALLRRARDIAPISLRAPSAVRNGLAELAQKYDNAFMIDAEALLPREDGLDVPASSLFLPDGMHFSREGHQALAAIMAPELRAMLQPTDARERAPL